MERAFLTAWDKARKAAQALGIRLRPQELTLENARRALSTRRLSDGFAALQEAQRLDLTLEALAVDRRFTALFTDQEANEALTRLLEAGYRF